jgi:small subunit ribosomal protein S20
MPTTKSAIRELALNKRRNEINKTRKSRVRTFIKNVEKAIVAGKKDEAMKALKAAQPEMLKSVSLGLFHKNTVARKLSRLTAQVKKLS